MGEFFKSTKFKILAAIVTALIIGTVFATLSHNGSSPVASAVSTVFSPIQRLSAFVSDGISNYSLNFKSSASYKKKVKELENQIEDYQLQLVEYAQAKQKLALYEEFLDVKEEHSDYKFEDASIIAKDSSDSYSSFVISKGTSSGIKINDPVIYGKHLVGVVTKVKPNSSVVKTILDPDVNVSAYEVQTREYGYVSTTNKLSEGGLCCFPGLDKSTSITTGSVICTSGIGGIYPKDLLVGTVTEVLNDTQSVAVYAVINPGIAISDLQDVFVIKSFDGQGVTTAD